MQTTNVIQTTNVLQMYCPFMLYGRKDNTMAKFKIPNIPPTTTKTIRFPNNVISDVEAAISGKDCTFTAFVVEAVRVALRNLEDTEWKDTLRQAIDEAKGCCKNRKEFQQYLQNNFGVIMTRNTVNAVSFVHPDAGEKCAIRGNTLGYEYAAESIDEALQENAEA